MRVEMIAWLIWAYMASSIIFGTLVSKSYAKPSEMYSMTIKRSFKLLENVKDIEEIAHLELKHKKLPFLICRSFNNEYKEYWKIEDLIIL